MPLKAATLALHEVPQEHRKLYVPVGDGTYRLDVEPVDGVGLGPVEELTTSLSKWKAHVERIVLSEKIEAALDAVQVDPVWRDVFIDRMTAAVRLREDGDDLGVDVIDDRGIERVTGRGERMTVADLAEDLKRQHPRCFIDAETKKPSTGSSKWPEPNPFTTGNVTEQGRLFRVDPELYARWKAEAEGRSGRSGLAENPFKRGASWNLSKQGELYRNDRTTYERLKAEASPE